MSETPLPSATNMQSEQPKKETQVMTANGHNSQHDPASRPIAEEGTHAHTPAVSHKEVQVEADVVAKKEDEAVGSDAGANAPEPVEANPLASASPPVAENNKEEAAEGPHAPPAAAPNDDAPAGDAKEETAGSRTGDDTTTFADAETSPQPPPRMEGGAGGEEEQFAQKREGESQQQQPAMAGVAAHRVFTEEELAAYMEKQRQREREKKEEVRQTKSRRTSATGGSRSRGSRGNVSSMRIPPIDANAAHLSQLQHAQQQFFTASNPAAPPLANGAATHPLAYQLAYPGASVPSPGAELPMPPYSNFFASNTAHPFNNRMPVPQPQQPFQQPTAFCAPWGVQMPQHSQFMGPPPPCSNPGIFDPATIMRAERQLQYANDLSAPFLHSSAIPPPPQGGMTGMNMQELEVLARLIVLARNEQQQQQQHLQFLLSQKQQAQPPHYCYYPGGQQSDVENVVNSLNASHGTHVGVHAPFAGNKMQDGAAAVNSPGVLEKDPAIVTMVEKRNGTHLE